MMKTVLNVATANPDKVFEFANALGDSYQLKSLLDYSDLQSPDENGQTLVDNAFIKADALFEYTGKLCVADDTGLCVDALGGEPGVYSARWAGAECSYADNVNKMIREISKVPTELRTARFETAIAIVGPGIRETVCGICDGIILDVRRGSSGFGYDPVFYVPEIGLTFSEMSTAQKNEISHRGRAIKLLSAFLDKLKTQI
jgi:XTP/dITP diphosphohydrolase